MAPKKKQRTEASSSSGSQPSQPKSRETILAKFKSRPIVPERGLAVKGPFEEYINTEDWFCFFDYRHICPGIRSCVCEFYTYLCMHQTNKVNVQGKTIDISTDAINDFYEIHHVREHRNGPGGDEYFIQSDYDQEKVMMELTGARRNLLSNWVHIQKAWLTPNVKKLNLWLDAHQLPASSHSCVSKRRVLSLVYLVQGFLRSCEPGY